MPAKMIAGARRARAGALLSSGVRWRDATVLITGGSRGIGRATAQHAARLGSAVAIVARGARDLDETRVSCGGRTVAIVADIRQRDDVARAVAETVAQLGEIDILVNCAGIGAVAAFDAQDPDQIDAVIATNVLGALHTTRAVLPSMTSHHRGHIVNVGSIAGRVPVAFESTYVASKFALAGFSKSLALELEPFGVGVSLITTGVVATGFGGGAGNTYRRRWPRPVTPERVAGLIVSAVERDRVECTIPRWLIGARIVESLASPLYRAGARRAVRAPAADERR